MPNESRLELSPYCAHLRSKKSRFLASPPRTEGDILDASRHCWCERTMQLLGPDRALVDPDDCRRGRSCFEPYGGVRAGGPPRG